MTMEFDPITNTPRSLVGEQPNYAPKIVINGATAVVETPNNRPFCMAETAMALFSSGKVLEVHFVPATANDKA